jgi:hypothetical protein
MFNPGPGKNMNIRDLDSSLTETNTYNNMALTSGFHQPTIIPKPSLVEATSDLKNVIQFGSDNAEQLALQVTQLLSYIKVLEENQNSLAITVKDLQVQLNNHTNQYSKDIEVLSDD